MVNKPLLKALFLMGVPHMGVGGLAMIEDIAHACTSREKNTPHNFFWKHVMSWKQKTKTKHTS